jgi:hypothetical protein
MSADNNKPEKRPGKFGKLLNFIVSVFGVLIISIFLSIVIEWLGIVFDWWQLPQLQLRYIALNNQNYCSTTQDLFALSSNNMIFQKYAKMC